MKSFAERERMFGMKNERTIFSEYLKFDQLKEREGEKASPFEPLLEFSLKLNLKF